MKKGLNNRGNIKNYMKKDTRNLISIIIGIFFILAGLGGVAITIPTTEPIIIIPALSLVIGAILSLLGGFRKW